MILIPLMDLAVAQQTHLVSVLIAGVIFLLSPLEKREENSVMIILLR